jgi:hypothetical protein
MIKKIVSTVLFVGFTSLSLAGDVYKYTDADGNTYYSDQKPSKDIPEEDLNKLTIIESSKMNPKSTWRRTNHIKKQQAAKFENFVIATPKDGSDFVITEGNLLAMVNLTNDLPPEYRIIFYLDDTQLGKVKSSTKLIADAKEGRHSLYAEVINAKSWLVIKPTPKINFNLKFKDK